MVGPSTRSSDVAAVFAALPPHSRVTLPLYLCLFTFVVAVDLTVAAPDAKMSGKTNNKIEGLTLSPRDFLTDNPGAFATWFACCCAKVIDAGVGPHDIFGINLTDTDQISFDKIWDKESTGKWNVREIPTNMVTNAWDAHDGMFGNAGHKTGANFKVFYDTYFPPREWDDGKGAHIGDNTFLEKISTFQGVVRARADHEELHRPRVRGGDDGGPRVRSAVGADARR